MECCRLRMKDIDVERGQLTVREGKGDKDRYVMLPHAAVAGLRARMEWRRELHAQDLSRGYGRVPLPAERRRSKNRGSPTRQILLACSSTSLCASVDEKPRRRFSN